MNRSAIALGTMMTAFLGIIGCTTTAPSSSDVIAKLSVSVQRQDGEIEELIRALASAQLATANANWWLIENAAEHNYRFKRELSDVAPLSDQDRAAIKEMARENLGKLLGYVTAREEDLLRAAKSCREAREALLEELTSSNDSSETKVGSTVAVANPEGLDSVVSLKDLDRLFRAPNETLHKASLSADG